jgi:tRNA(Ile)-lysidine synthase
VLSRVPGDGLAGVFDRFDLAGRKVVMAAVSGGGDSTALLLLLQDHIRRRGLSMHIVAATVDHRLRSESAAEAGGVATFCTARGIAHRTLRWEGEKPATGLSAAARTARYDLLGAAAEAAGTDIVFTGHTLDDQVETVAMRSARGAGRGLAGMAPATLYEGRTWILRPLIETGRETLRDYLRLKDVSWVEDPSNENPRYERARMRRLLAREDGAAAGAGLDGIRAAQAERVALGEKAAALISGHLSRPAPGLYRIDRAFFEAVDGDAALYALRLVLATVGGMEHLPDSVASEVLFSAVRNGPARATLSRTLVDARKSHVFLHRERRGLPDAVPVSGNMIWDNRFRVTGGGEGLPGFLIAPGGASESDRVVEGDAPVSLAAAALAAEPALLRKGGDAARPIAGGPAVSLTPVAAPFLHFLSSFDIAPARALAGLTGSVDVPAPPLARNGRSPEL